MDTGAHERKKLFKGKKGMQTKGLGEKKRKLGFHIDCNGPFFFHFFSHIDDTKGLRDTLSFPLQE